MRRQGDARSAAALADEAELRAKLTEITGRRPAVGLAVGVVRNGRPDLFHGHGVADIASSAPLTEDTVFRIASITKTFTAVAVLQLYERGLIDLDAPANDYVRAYELIAASPTHRPATVRHLLTHTAGVSESAHPWGAVLPDFGESVKVGGRCRPSPSSTGAVCDFRPSPAPGSGTATTGSPPLASSSKMSAGNRSIGTSASTSSIRSA
jgi:CubicO group peptidase (beta-lactamase class C family)